VKLCRPFTLGLLLVLFGCQHGAETPERQWGSQPLYVGFIPGQIVVLPSQVWPQAATYENQPLTNATKEDQAKLCAQLDQTVLDGFVQQPYMNGFTPKSVSKQLEQTFPDYLDKMKALWQTAPCPLCKNPLEFYVTRSMPQPAWLNWLQTVSHHTRYSDAVLLPLVRFAQETRFEDRGRWSSQRAMGVILLLIHTRDGSLIWSGTQTSMLEESDAQSTQPIATPYPPYPAWEKGYPALFNESLWKGFPGRLFRPT